MEQHKLMLLALATILVAALMSTTDAKKASNQTDHCYKPCTVKSSPVCGNDGRNYTTGCHLSIARCRARKFGQRIFAVNTGYCRSSKPVSLCRLNCTERRAPVCASDQKTYKNLCLFKKAKCEKRKNKEPPVTVVNRRGSCVKKASSCRTFASCPKVKKPVCGSNDVTYKNICHLKTTNCRRKRNWEKARKTRNSKSRKYTKITLKHWGACGKPKQCSQQKCPEAKFCDQLLRAAVRYAEAKKSTESKGDGKKAPRSSKKKSKSKKKLNLKKTSSKKTNSKKTSPKKNGVPKKAKPKTKTGKTSKTGKNGETSKTAKTSKKPTSQTSKKPAKKVGPKKVYQVCGSDGKTYRSICHLQVEQCNKSQKCERLQMKHKGTCKTRTANKGKS